jgi:phospholipid/cholesterol/gamma-HCH transport system substrate-binding protein
MVREQWVETGVGAVVLVAAASFLFYSLTAEGPSRGHGYAISAKFGQVGALAPGANVSVAGVKVGTVTTIDLDPKTYQAIVRLDLDPKIPLPADSTAKITSDGLLGGAHITIEPGGSTENLKPGGEIANTQGAVDLFGLVGQMLRPQQNPPAPETPVPAAAAAGQVQGAKSPPGA